jgi:hypothetical protein
MDRKLIGNARSDSNQKFPGLPTWNFLLRGKVKRNHLLWKYPVHLRSDPGGQFTDGIRSEDRKFPVGFRSESGRDGRWGITISPGPDWGQNFHRALSMSRGGASARGRRKAHVKFLGAHRARPRSALWPVRAWISRCVPLWCLYLRIWFARFLKSIHFIHYQSATKQDNSWDKGILKYSSFYCPLKKSRKIIENYWYRAKLLIN